MEKKLLISLTREKFHQVRLQQIIDRTKKGGAEIVKFLEKRIGILRARRSGVEMAESYLKDLKKQLPCAAYLNGEYGASNIYAGVPVIIGSKGVEKVVELKLSENEKINFKKNQFLQFKNYLMQQKKSIQVCN